MKDKSQPYTANELSPMNCICCGQEIHLIKWSENDDCLLDKDGKPIDPENLNWNDGVVQNVYAGYGSNLDGNVYLIAICDKCLEQKNKEGKAIFIYDYISNHNIEKRREEMNKTFHRKLKLNRIDGK